MSPHNPDKASVKVTVTEIVGFDTSTESLTQPVSNVISALHQVSTSQESLAGSLSGMKSTRPIKDVDSLISTASNHIADLKGIAIQDGLGVRPSKFIWAHLLRVLGEACCEQTEVITDVPFVGPGSGDYDKVYQASFLLAFAITGKDLDAILTKLAPSASPDKLSTGVIHPTHAIHLIHDHNEKEPSADSGDHRKNDSLSLPASFHKWIPSNNPCHNFASHFANFELTDQEEFQYNSQEEIPYEMHIFPRSISQSTFVPILCAADANNIVPLIASLVCLYHTWHISLPVIGLQTSQFDGKVAVYIGYMSSSNDSKELHVQIRAPLSQDSTVSDTNSIGHFDLSQTQSATKFSTFILSMQSHFSQIKTQIETYTSMPLSDSMKQIEKKWKSYENSDIQVLSTPWTSLISKIPQDIWTNSSIISWMLERDSLPILKVANINDLKELRYSKDINIKDNNIPIEIKELSTIYNQLLGNCWLEEWNSEKDIPDVYQDLSQYKTQLYSRYTELDKSQIIFLNSKEINKDILIQELSVLLDNVKQVNIHSNNFDSNYQNIWDLLLFSFYRNNTSNFSILYNQYIKLPKNSGQIDNTTYNSLFHRLINWSSQLQVIFNYMENEKINNTALSLQFLTLLFVTEQSLSTFKTLSDLNNTRELHSQQDPIYGNSDVSLFATYQIRLQAQYLQMFKTISPFFQSLQDEKHSIANTEVTRASDKIQIILPQLTVAYTKSGINRESAFNEACIQSVATAKYLSSLGITEFPVFALAIYKTFCGVIMAQTSADNVTSVITHNIKTYNIADPFDAFQFALFLMRLKSREEELRELFKKNEEKVIKALRGGSSEQWSMSDTQGTQEQM